jgi:hypothetical protein
MKSGKRKNGEYLPLCWEGSDPPAEYVYGHVSREEAIKAICAETGANPDDFKDSRHLYGRWSMTGRDDVDMEMYTYRDPGRGRFPITEVRI